jgi:PPOX class probable F420-dependent enzyme
MLPERVIELARAKTFAIVTTLLPDGTPVSKPLWIDTDGEHLVINTEVHRLGYRNLERDPRVTVTLVDPANPYAYAEVRGKVADTETGPNARAHIDELSRKYLGQDYPGKITSERVVVRIAPQHHFVRT